MKIHIKNKKIVIMYLGYGVGIGSYIVMTITFFYAFFNDGYAMVACNLYNEMYAEAILIPICFLLNIVGFYYFNKEYIKKVIA